MFAHEGVLLVALSMNGGSIGMGLFLVGRPLGHRLVDRLLVERVEVLAGGDDISDDWSHRKKEKTFSF